MKAASKDLTSEPTRTRSRSRFVLYFLWVSLGAWLAFGFLHGATFRNDAVALPALAFLMTSAIIGSRIYLYFLDRTQAHSAEARRPLPAAL